MELGEYIKYLRKKKGLTIVGLSKVSNLSKSYISQLERGERGTSGISFGTLKMLSEALKVTQVDLLQHTGILEQTDYKKLQQENARLCKALEKIAYSTEFDELYKVEAFATQVLEEVSK